MSAKTTNDGPEKRAAHGLTVLSELASSLVFQGQHHTAINVGSNGYVTFGPYLSSVTSEATRNARE